MKKKQSVRERIALSVEECLDIDVLFDYGLRTFFFCPFVILLCFIGSVILLHTDFILAPLLVIMAREFSKILAIVYLILLPVLYPMLRGIIKRRKEIYKRMEKLDDSIKLSHKMKGKYYIISKSDLLSLTHDDSIPTYSLYFLDLLSQIRIGRKDKTGKKNTCKKNTYKMSKEVEKKSEKGEEKVEEKMDEWEEIIAKTIDEEEKALKDSFQNPQMDEGSLKKREEIEVKDDIYEEVADKTEKINRGAKVRVRRKRKNYS